MLSLLLHAIAGVITTGISFWLNRPLYTSGWKGSRISPLEFAYYILSVVSVCIGWYFNIAYVKAYPAEASWAHYIKMLFTNEAAASGSQDYIIANVFLFPMWIVSDGRRRGLRGSIVFFIMSLFTSFGFSMGLYLAAQERTVRLNAARNS